MQLSHKEQKFHEMPNPVFCWFFFFVFFFLKNKKRKKSSICYELNLLRECFTSYQGLVSLDRSRPMLYPQILQ